MGDRRSPRLLVVVTAVLVTLGAGVAPAAAQDCGGPPVNGARWAWPKNASVVVNISPEFREVYGATRAIESAFRGWQDAGRSSGNGSGVTFSFVYRDDHNPTPLTFRVIYGYVPAGRQARTLISSQEGGVVLAWCIVDRRVDDPFALAQLVAHEIGHTFGLAECETCEPGSSVMTSFGGDFNDATNGRNAPSECDNRAVRENAHY